MVHGPFWRKPEDAAVSGWTGRGQHMQRPWEEPPLEYSGIASLLQASQEARDPSLSQILSSSGYDGTEHEAPLSFLPLSALK